MSTVETTIEDLYEELKNKYIEMGVPERLAESIAVHSLEFNCIDFETKFFISTG